MDKILEALRIKYGQEFWKLVIYADESGYAEGISDDAPLFEFDTLEELIAEITNV